MSISVVIPVKNITFTQEDYDKWVKGDRDDCPDKYCRRLPGSKGFGEYIVGRYFSTLGYDWIHHDYNVFGGNKLGKYKQAEEVLMNYFGKEKFESARTIYKAFRNFEEPDLMIYKPDFTELRFAESKRLDTRDKLREPQIRGLALLSILLGCKVELFEVARQDKIYQSKDIVFEFD